MVQFVFVSFSRRKKEEEKKSPPSSLQTNQISPTFQMNIIIIYFVHEYRNECNHFSLHERSVFHSQKTLARWKYSAYIVQMITLVWPSIQIFQPSSQQLNPGQIYLQHVNRGTIEYWGNVCKIKGKFILIYFYIEKFECWPYI